MPTSISHSGTWKREKRPAQPAFTASSFNSVRIKPPCDIRFPPRPPRATPTATGSNMGKERKRSLRGHKAAKKRVDNNVTAPFTYHATASSSHRGEREHSRRNEIKPTQTGLGSYYRPNTSSSANLHYGEPDSLRSERRTQTTPGNPSRSHPSELEESPRSKREIELSPDTRKIRVNIPFLSKFDPNDWPLSESETDPEDEKTKPIPRVRLPPAPIESRSEAPAPMSSSPGQPGIAIAPVPSGAFQNVPNNKRTSAPNHQLLLRHNTPPRVSFPPPATEKSTSTDASTGNEARNRGEGQSTAPKLWQHCVSFSIT